MLKTHTIEQTVRYVETDRMGVVHHSTYLYWFEIGRTGLLAHVGYPYHELERSGTLFPVTEYACRMVGSSDYGDTVEVETSIDFLRSRGVVFAYKVFNRGELIATGVTRHVPVDANHKVRRMPEALVRALSDYVKPDAG